MNKRYSSIIFGLVFLPALVAGIIFGATSARAVGEPTITKFVFDGISGLPFKNVTIKNPMDPITLYYTVSSATSCRIIDDLGATIVSSWGAPLGVVKTFVPQGSAIYKLLCINGASAEISKTVMLTATEAIGLGSASIEMKNSDSGPIIAPLLIDGVTATPTSGNFNISNLKVGTHFISVDSGGSDTITIGGVQYYVPQPKEGRRFTVFANSTTNLALTFYKMSDLKNIDRSTAEALVFDNKGNSLVDPAMYLVKGVAAISEDKIHWQYSAAEVLLISPMSALITASKSDDTSLLINPGIDFTTTYDLDVAVDNITDGGTLTINDTVTPASAIKGIRVKSANIISASYSVATAGTNSLSITINSLVHATNYHFEVEVTIAKEVTANSVITNTATFTTGTEQTTKTDIDIVTYSFLKESTGGSVFGRKGVNLRNPSSVLYIIGSGGNIASQSKSASDWTVGAYGISSNSPSSFGLDEDKVCQENSACGIIEKSRTKLINGAKIAKTSYGKGSLTSATIDLNPTNIPEGGALYYSDGLTIGNNSGSPMTLRGRGTVVVDGDLSINDSLQYENKNKDMVGFIVKNGNVNVSPRVGRLEGVFFIYSDKANTGQKGSFISGSCAITPAACGGETYDKQLVIHGVVIASGWWNVSSRSEAFQLYRNYIGPKELLWSCDNALPPICKGSIKPNDPKYLDWQPAEDFQYDPRVVLSPPPGFAKEVFKARQ